MTTPIRTAYTTADRPLAAVLDAVPTDAWGRPSTCEGWTVREVVRHLVQTQREFLTGRGVDLGEEPDVDADPAAAWRAHALRVAAALADEQVAGREYDGFFGRTTLGASLAQFYVWDMLVHRWTSPAPWARTPGSPTPSWTASRPAPRASARRSTWTASAGTRS